MSENIICPACGSHHLTRSEEVDSSQLTLGAEFNFIKEVYTCNVCGESGDFALTNDSKFEVAQKNAQIHSMKAMVEGLSEEKDISMAYFERAFELPVRTLTRWKTGDFSSAALALLRTVRTYPFIVDVAASGFDPDFARRQLYLEGAKVIKASMRSGFNFDYSCETDGNLDTYYMSFSGPTAKPQVKMEG
jgi:DNA-binding transcriptional regulator YiaG